MPKPKKVKADLSRWKAVEEMTGPEVVNEAESLASYAEGCRKCGDGINSKEVIRFKQCMERIEVERLTNAHHTADLHCQWDDRLYKNHSMLVSLFELGGTLEGMRKLFAPA